MKIAILSDIHGNLPALEAVTEDIEQWQPDVVVVNGDTINRGANSLACCQRIQQKQQTHQWKLLLGNHEDYVLQHTQPNAQTEGILFEINYNSYWTYQQCQDELKTIAQLPRHTHINTPHGTVHCYHASIHSNRDGLYPTHMDQELAERAYTDKAKMPAVFATSHVHVPFIRPLDGLKIVNSGAVGSVCDGDLRASYAQVSWHKQAWHAEIVRVPYDREQEMINYRTSGFLSEVGPMGWLIYHEWRLGEKILPWWIRDEQPKVVAGKLPLYHSIKTYLDKLGLTMD